MKYTAPKLLLFTFALLLSFRRISPASALSFPYLDNEGQSNVVVSIHDEGGGVPSPERYENRLTNGFLFSAVEQEMIRSAFRRYKNTSILHGPSGEEVAGKTSSNLVTSARGRITTNKSLFVTFVSTNFAATDTVEFWGTMPVSVTHRTKKGDGYNLTYVKTGHGVMARLSSVTNGVKNGPYAIFEEVTPRPPPQNPNAYDYSDFPLTEYRRYSNGLVIGKFLMWNPTNDFLFLSADFIKPCALEKHRTDLSIIGYQRKYEPSEPH